MPGAFRSMGVADLERRLESTLREIAYAERFADKIRQRIAFLHAREERPPLTSGASKP